ncbi:MAG: response regulator, partial [Planctomycetes bacterium]|nr:response regulator [Planctomycetota bacterium]
GILVMARAFGDRYLEALQRVRRIAHLNLTHVEQDCFGTTHAEVSAALLRKWELPGSFTSLVLRHHDRDDSERPVKDQRFLRAMRIGEALSDLHDNRGPQRYHALQSLTDHYGAAAGAACRACLAAAVAKTAEASEIFSVPAPAPEALEAMLLDIAEQEKLRSLPGAKAATKPAAPAPVDSLQKHEDEGPTILVIDDEPSVARMVSHYLREWSCRVVACDDRAAAKRLAADADIVLCDIHLREENGIDLVRELRNEQFDGPVIIVSGDGYRSTVLDSIQAGVNDYLLKPFLKTQLIDKVRKYLGAELQAAASR